MKAKNTLPTGLQVDLLLNYLSSNFVEGAYSSQAKKDARKRLELRREAKENIASSKKDSVSQLDPEVSVIQTLFIPSSVAQEHTPNEKEGLKLFLDEMADRRKKNELIYGYKESLVSSEINERWGIEASEVADCYKSDFESTSASDFIITFDNKIILNLTVGDHLMGCGSFLKAAGRLTIENNKLHITPYNRYLGGVLGPHYIPIILFVLQEKGFPVTRENICVMGGEAAVDFYLDENRFPSAKTLAGNKKISIELSLAELFLDIDDEILNARSQALIKAVDIKRAELQADVINFLLLVANFGEKKDKTQEKVEEAPLVVEETAYQCYEKIVNCIQAFKVQHGRDISFIESELFSWSYYLIALSFQVESDIKIGYETGQALVELTELKNTLKKIKESPSTISQRLKNDAIETSFLRFYTENPVKTCVSLLRDYTKGGFFGRFFSGAWNRHHIKTVNSFLQSYEDEQFADDLSIQAIYQRLFGEVNTLSEYSGKQGTLYARLLFCARLNNEIESSESLNYPSSSMFVAANELPEAISEILNRDNLNVGDSVLSRPGEHSRRSMSLSIPNESLIDKQFIESYPSSSLRKQGVFYPPNSDELDELFEDKKFSPIPLPTSASIVDDQSISRSSRNSSQENVSFFSPVRGEVSDSEKTSSYGSPAEPSVLSSRIKDS